MKKLLLITILFIVTLTVSSQTKINLPKNDVSTSTNLEVLSNKGNKVFLIAADNFSEEGIPFLNEGLNELGYWEIVESGEKADFIMELKCRKQQQMTVVAVYSIVKFINANGDVVYETKEYKGTPTAFNGYSSFKGSVLKLIDKALKNKFK